MIKKPSKRHRAKLQLEERLNPEGLRQNLRDYGLNELQTEMYTKQFQDWGNKLYHTLNVKTER